ncbi:hypothetical protein SprV_0200834200 [Sparganum proliferum]
MDCPERLMYVVLHLHDVLMAPVTDKGTVSDALAVASEVKHGCVLAPTLFSLMSSAMLMDAGRNECSSISIFYKIDR